jgi:hypothetical protein
MDFVGSTSHFFASFEFCDDVRVTCGRDECGEPVESRDDAILDLARWDNGVNVKRTCVQCIPQAAVEGLKNGECKFLARVRESFLIGEL